MKYTNPDALKPFVAVRPVVCIPPLNVCVCVHVFNADVVAPPPPPTLLLDSIVT